MGFWPYVRIEGEAHVRGTSYGHQAKDLIRQNIEVYRQFFQARYQADWQRVRNWAARFIPRIEALDPDLAVEIRAVASASGVDLLDIIILNARSSFPPASTDGCTAIAHLGRRKDGEGPLLGQNWDNMAGLKAIVLNIDQPNHPAILTLTEAGMAGKMGVNARGVALCVNGLFAAEQQAADGVPIFCLMRKALQARSLSEAIGVITGSPRDAAHNYLVVSGEGAAFDIEALPRAFDILTPTASTLVHTNHILSPRLLMHDDGKARFPDTVVRLWRAKAMLADREAAFGVRDLITILGDHFDAPGSICRHGQNANDDQEVRTKCAIIIEPRSGRMHISAGYPCSSPFESFELNGGLSSDGPDTTTPSPTGLRVDGGGSVYGQC